MFELPNIPNTKVEMAFSVCQYRKIIDGFQEMLTGSRHSRLRGNG